MSDRVRLDGRDPLEISFAGRRIDRWLALGRDGTVTLFTGKVEIGQGVRTALAQIVAEELDVPLARVRVAPVDTTHSPDEGYTSGSHSMQESGVGLAHLAAEARHVLLERAAARLGVGIGELSVEDGEIRAPGGRRIPYADLAGADVFACETSGTVAVKRPDRHRIVGTSARRPDLEAKIAGRPAYVHDLELPGMLHARILRPPSYEAALRSLDEAAVRALPGVVAVVRDGSFVGIVAEREELAIRALEAARRLAVWDERETLPPTSDARELLREPEEPIVVRDLHGAAGRSVRTMRAEYSRPYIAHAAIGPSCAVAVATEGRMRIWAHTQGPYPLRREIAKVLRCPVDAIEITHMEGAGCYGHNGADDVALDAALLARALPGRPIRVQWTREDEFAWEPYGPAMLVRLAAELDPAGRIVGWSHELWSTGHGNRPSSAKAPDTASLLAARHLADPFVASTAPKPRDEDSGATRNAPPAYDFAHQRVVSHWIRRNPVRVSALRSLGAHTNVFAIESFIDEIAESTGVDPIDLRLRHLPDERARAVVRRVADMASWRAGEKGDGVTGRGVAFARYKNHACYVATIVEVALGDDIRVRRAWAAVDAGLIVDPDGLANQIEGGLIQAISWTLKERVRFDATRITTRGWEEYPILTFSEAPDVDVALIDRPDEPPLGVGEGCAGPVAGAIANAIHNAAGVRLRDMPFTRDRFLAAMD